MRHVPLAFFAVALFALPAFPQTPDARINPEVQQIVDAISEQRIAATLQKLESFGTRYILSAQDDPAHGIDAAKRWIHDQLKRYNPLLEVSYQNFTIKKGVRQGQVIRDLAGFDSGSETGSTTEGAKKGGMRQDVSGKGFRLQSTAT